MRTSGTCPGNRRPRHRAGTGGGYTLLELVVVLALLGLATALVAPAGIRTIESWRRATDVDAALDALAGVGTEAARQGRGMTLEAGAVPADELDGLPLGWTVVLDAPLEVQANGACSDASGELRDASGYSRRFELLAPFCRVLTVLDQT